jgi:NYN domain
MAIYVPQRRQRVRRGKAQSAGGSKSGCAYIDVDNILHNGFDQSTGLAHRRATLNLKVFSKALAASGIRDATAFAHHCNKSQRVEWAHRNIALVETNANADEQIALSAINNLLRHWQENYKNIPRLIIVSGDHCFCDLVEAARAAGTEVHIWTRSDKASFRLLNAANEWRLIDNMLADMRPQIN